MLKTQSFCDKPAVKKPRRGKIFRLRNFSAAGIPVYSYRPFADWEDTFHHFHAEKGTWIQPSQERRQEYLLEYLLGTTLTRTEVAGSLRIQQIEEWWP